MTRELKDIPDLDVLFAEQTSTLMVRKVQLAFQLHDIEGQLLERSSPEDELSGWRRKAKTKAHYLRQALAAVNGVIAAKNQQLKEDLAERGLDEPFSVVVAFHKLINVWEAAQAATDESVPDLDDDDEEIIWSNLATAVRDAREVYLLTAVER